MNGERSTWDPDRKIPRGVVTLDVDSGGESIGSPIRGLPSVAGGCLSTLGSTIISCVLLLSNGALVMAILAACSAADIQWVRVESAAQFVLFGAPVALLVIQWMMIDKARQIMRS